nr:MAG TPA: hypothetical protein [Caudoviricetes sp.]
MEMYNRAGKYVLSANPVLNKRGLIALFLN